MDLLNYIQSLATFLAGGGIFWLLNWRKRARRESQKLDVEEFDAVSTVVERATKQIAELAEKVSVLERARADTTARIRHLEEDNERLKKENERMAAALGRYFLHDPNLNPLPG